MLNKLLTSPSINLPSLEQNVKFGTKSEDTRVLTDLFVNSILLYGSCIVNIRVLILSMYVKVPMKKNLQVTVYLLSLGDKRG